MALFEYDPPERFVAGTVGPAGQRQFFLQATGGGRTTTVSLEKLQVNALADRINDMLDEFAAGEASEQAAEALLDNAPLDTPIEEEFRVGTMRLDWEPASRRLIVECHAAGDAFDEADEALAETLADPALDPSQIVLRVAMSPAGARAFARRSVKVVAAGRPPCPFCAAPLDPAGHVCPRANGYKR
ncbi:DUF3090 family protein [Gephyromycinifex aptenodytis]|uniref:DUF3090 family protein n=1 Tax=Gephyromycinifex aptenodytis TaxID=2716227 RepID=UPI0014480415|nr:DUF3090 family protein [Gephyromycinifex aptenodytis]